MSSPALIPAAGAFAVILSVIVRWIRSGAAWGAVDEGFATADVLRELTGVLTRDDLQEAFGPARLQDGVYPVTRAEVMRRRTAIGYLLGDRWFDGGSMAIAVLCLLPIWPLWGTRPWAETLLMFAGVYQIAGWVAATMLIGRK